MTIHVSHFKTVDSILNSFVDNIDAWLKVTTSTLINRTDSNTYKLWIVYLDGGFMINYTRDQAPRRRRELSLFSLNDRSRFNEFYEIDESFYLISCFIDAATAQKIVAEYCKDPTQPPPSGNWLGENKLPWPSLNETREEWAARGVKLIWPKSFHY